jgi:glucokinase
MGVDVGGTCTKWTVLEAGRVSAGGTLPTPRTGPREVLDAVVALVQGPGARCGRVGLAVPGTVDPAAQETLVVPNLPGAWTRYPVGRLLAERTGRSVHLVNDARAFGQAELDRGAAAGCADVVFFTLGTGVGGALAQGGRVVVGTPDDRPELGHVPVEEEGERCGCGALGCLETVASAPAVTSRCARAVLTGASSTLTELCGGLVGDLTAEMVGAAAGAGDPWARDALARAGRAVGVVAAACLLLVRVERVVLGGGLAGAFDHLAPAVEQVLRPRALLAGRAGGVDVVAARLGAGAGALGAALHAALDGVPAGTSTSTSTSSTSSTDGRRPA